MAAINNTNKIINTIPTTSPSSGIPQSVEQLKSDDFFARVSDCAGEKLLEEVNKLQLSDADLEEISQAFLNAEFEKLPEDFIPTAFLAYFEEKINRNQLATLCLYEAMETLPDSVNYSIDFHPDCMSTYKTVFDCEEIDLDMSNFSPLDKTFFILNADLSRNELIPEVLTRMQQETFDIGTLKENHDFIPFYVPSPQLITETMKAKFGDNAISPNPVFGFSDDPKYWTDINRRDAAIPCRYFPQPKTIHNFRVDSEYDIYFHDVRYHLYLDSANPYKESWFELAELFWNDNEMRDFYLDREARNYYRNEKYGEDFPPEALFIAQAILKSPGLVSHADTLMNWLANQNTFKVEHLDCFCEKHNLDKEAFSIFREAWLNAIETKQNVSLLDKV